MKTSELIDAALDWAVAKALGYTDSPDDSLEHGTIWHTEPDKTPFGRFIDKQRFQPSTNWTIAGPLIERERIDLLGCVYGPAGDWTASRPRERHVGWRHLATGPTPLVAAMRCLVMSRLGDEVEIPEELL